MVDSPVVRNPYAARSRSGGLRKWIVIGSIVVVFALTAKGYHRRKVRMVRGGKIRGGNVEDTSTLNTVADTFGAVAEGVGDVVDAGLNQFGAWTNGFDEGFGDVVGSEDDDYDDEDYDDEGDEDWEDDDEEEELDEDDDDEEEVDEDDEEVDEDEEVDGDDDEEVDGAAEEGVEDDEELDDEETA